MREVTVDTPLLNQIFRTYSDRNIALAKDVLSGMGLREAGRKYGISPQRCTVVIGKICIKKNRRLFETLLRDTQAGSPRAAYPSIELLRENREGFLQSEAEKPPKKERG